MLEKMQQYGMLGYSINDICIIDGFDKKKFTEEFNNKNSDIYKAYQKGAAVAKLNIETKLFNQAKEGDIEAIKLIDERNQQNEINNLKSKYFGI